MPIVHQREERFPGVDTNAVRRVHRLAIVFGLIFPLVILLAAVLQSGSFSLWPTALARLYERTYALSWAGLYVFGLLMFLVPSLLDRSLHPQEQKRLNTALYVFAAGRLLVLIGRLFHSTADGHAWGSLIVFAGDFVSLVGWVLMQHQVFRWFSSSKKMDLHLFAVMAGMVFFVAGLALHTFVDIMLWRLGTPFAPIPWLFSMRALPMIGVGLILLSLLLRLAPEMLGWRPLSERRLKALYGAVLVAGFLISVGYPYFHKLSDVAGALMYGLGAFVSMGLMVWLFMSIDFWHIRLMPSVNREHVMGIYASLIWLLLSSGYFIVLCFWELMHRRVVLSLWSEPLLYAVVGGFFAQAMFGLYTYITNELDGSYAHSDRLMTWSLVMFNWALVIRVFLFPFMIAYGWEGAGLIKFVLDALIYVSVLLVSADLLIALGGPFQFRRAILKK